MHQPLRTYVRYLFFLLLALSSDRERVDCYKRVWRCAHSHQLMKMVHCAITSIIAISVSLALAAADSDPSYYGGDSPRPLLVQPIPETKPICHIEYDVVTKTHCKTEHRQDNSE